MNSEFRDRIYQAEALRVSGKLPAAMEAVKDTLVDPVTIKDMSDEVLSDHIRQWRIFAVAGMSLAQKRWLARNAGDALLLTNPVFRNYYRHPSVTERARDFLVDNENHPYDHRAEMIRDEGKYWLVAFYISGNPRFLYMAERVFAEAVSSATLDSPKGIALVELGQIKRIMELRQAKKTKGALDGSTYQAYIHKGFETALPTVLQTGDKDRLAWLLNSVIDEIQYLSKLSDQIPSIVIQDEESTQSQFRHSFGEETNKTRVKHQIRVFTLSVHRVLWGLSRFDLNQSRLNLFPS